VIARGEEPVVELRDVDGDVFRLVGTQMSALASVDGAEVVAWGSYDAHPGFAVDQFAVTEMHGRPALDGVLEVTRRGYALRLASGRLRALPGAPRRCAEYIGSRIWVVGWKTGETLEFGLIASV
jgi:hypothetical protein